MGFKSGTTTTKPSWLTRALRALLARVIGPEIIYPAAALAAIEAALTEEQ